MIENLEADIKDEDIAYKEGTTLIESNKDDVNEDFIKTLENPEDKKMSYFSEIMNRNVLPYQDLDIKQQERTNQGLVKWQKFLIYKLSDGEKKIEDRDGQINFINALYALLQEQKYIKLAGISDQVIDTKQYEETINTYLPSRLDTFSKTTMERSYYDQGKNIDMVGTGSDGENIGIYDKILIIMQMAPIENKPLYDKKIYEHITAVNQELQKCADDATGYASGAEDYLPVIMQCLITHKTMHDGEISDTFRKGIENTLSLLQSLLEKQSMDTTYTTERNMGDISKELFYGIKLSQTLGETRYFSLLEDFGKKYAGAIAGMDIQQENQENKERRTNRNNRLYENLDKICSEYNTNAQTLELKKSYQITKNDHSVDLTFTNDQQTTTITLEYGPQIVVKVSNKKGHVFLTLDYLIERMEHEDIQSIIKEIDQEAQNSTKEKNKMLKKFDLPKDEPIQYTRIFQNNDAGFVPGTLLASQALEQELQKSYQINATDPQITGDPETVIKSALKDNYPAQKNFFFDLYAHGSPTQLLFEKPLTADFLIQLSKDYPDCRFFISTVGCYGGGLIDISKEGKDLKNLYIFTQTKNYLPNTPNRGSTIYSKALLKGLQKGKTYGEAVYEADKMVNELNYSDAESFLGGEYITENKKTNEQTEQRT